jgi:hypothetical protein
MVTTQEPVPEQAPDQPMNLNPSAAEALSVTFVPSAKTAEQVPGQAMPAGELVTVPPLPLTVTVSVSIGVPFCATANMASPPATTRSPLRLLPGFAATVYEIVADPVPLAGVKVSQLALLCTVHPQVLPVVMVNVPFPPPTGSVTLVGESV